MSGLRCECSVSGCDRPVDARGFCKAHYSRWRKHGDPLIGGPIRVGPRIHCRAEGCTRHGYRRGGLCDQHSAEWAVAHPPRPYAPRGRVKPFIAVMLATRDRSSGCWMDWPFGRSDGRPTLRHEGRRVLVAPYVVWLETGSWPPLACHSCDVGECWNPAHLYAGTHATNARDRDERDRGANQFGPWISVRKRKRAS